MYYYSIIKLHTLSLQFFFLSLLNNFLYINFVIRLTRSHEHKEQIEFGQRKK